jgi:hypothetical protein
MSTAGGKSRKVSTCYGQQPTAYAEVPIAYLNNTTVFQRHLRHQRGAERSRMDRTLSNAAASTPVTAAGRQRSATIGKQLAGGA